jgi:hypothetical protein
MRDARLLATMDTLSVQLSPGLRDSLATSIRSAAGRVELPSGAEITITA